MYRVLKFLGLSVLLTGGMVDISGCSDTVLSNKWAREVSDPDVWPLADAKDGMWLQNVDSLPLELHLADRGGYRGALSSNNILPNRVLSGSESDSAVTQRRIVLYIDGATIPIRDDFCAVKKEFRKTDVISDRVTLRAALCDGPRILTYGKKELSINSLESSKVNAEIVALSHSLVGSLYPPLTDGQERELKSEQ